MRKLALGIIKKIKLSGHKKLNTVYSGKYRSAFRGNGILFDNLREYEPGDEVKAIDWNVSAKAGKLYVREYIEERELNIVLAIDSSASMEFGTDAVKRDKMLEFVGVILQLAEHNNDSVSVALFTDRVEWFYRGKRGARSAVKILEKIMTHRCEGRKTSIESASTYLSRILKKRSVVFMISDFIDAEYEMGLSVLSRKHQLIPVRISDPAEEDFSYSGVMELYDLETEKVVYTSNAESVPVKMNSLLELSTAGDVLMSVIAYFEKRNKRNLRRW